MSAARAAGRLDSAAARRLTDQLAAALDLAVELLGQVFDGRAWSALGYASWDDYCTAELPQLAVLGRGMPVDERRATVAALRGRGMSLRAIGAPLGLAPNTVRADLAAAGDQLAEVVSLDGRRRPAARGHGRTPAPKAPALVDRIVALLAGHPEGLTVHDVAKQLRARQAQTSPALCRLAAAGRVDYVAPARRGQVGRYVAGHR